MEREGPTPGTVLRPRYHDRRELRHQHRGLREQSRCAGSAGREQVVPYDHAQGYALAADEVHANQVLTGARPRREEDQTQA